MFSFCAAIVKETFQKTVALCAGLWYVLWLPKGGAAMYDYMKALQKLKKYPRDSEARQMRNDCESFFRSSWYSALTSVDGEFLMRKLQMEVAA